jgi:hypothetical protein
VLESGELVTNLNMKDHVLIVGLYDVSSDDLLMQLKIEDRRLHLALSLHLKQSTLTP